MIWWVLIQQDDAGETEVYSRLMIQTYFTYEIIYIWRYTNVISQSDCLLYIMGGANELNNSGHLKLSVPDKTGFPDWF